LRTAAKLNIPSVLHEGNYYPGVTVKMLAPKVDKLILNFEESKKFFKKKDNIMVMAYPVRQNLKKYPRDDANKFFGLTGSKKTLFVFGGSQGANSINKALLDVYKNLIDNKIQIIWQTGYKDYGLISSIVSDNEVKLFKFIDKIDYAYSASDLVLCRSGISAVMEIAKFGTPVVFVPLPSASENHQEKNARLLVEKNAAEIILDKDLKKELSEKILNLINDVHKLQQLSINIQKFADKDAALKIAEFLIKIPDEM
ncbi:MAG: UDP-N-acetylglucosamine--N-acetylmuramyl-(pentapeptide) pyrophosphoryl-undecaprenol N-acetylglucosamine transferase, partial [Ignavibacteria bacterium]